jgi:hypothetical protein
MIQFEECKFYKKTTVLGKYINIRRQWLQQINALSSQLLFEQLSASKEKQTSITLEKSEYYFEM